ncbi:aspartic proteinase nepenthesin-1-like [Typha angustifolia]|uniref:aspartic proteinase nepenthesin-1-like n=1 Tax=Typha angustifolia TaxID=59011 RepID=UPI003C2C4624
MLLSKATASTAATHNSITEAHIIVHPGEGEFLMYLSIGTPPRPFSAILDTGSDLIWTQCTPCILCVEQPTPIFEPLKSSTFSSLSCSTTQCQALPSPLCLRNLCVYFYGYGDFASTAGVLATETFTFGSSEKVSIPHIAFGCGNMNEGSLANSSGMVGFGRGPLSLINQLGQKRFSYCLTNFLESKSSSLLFGSLVNLSNTNIGQVQQTPLLINPSRPSLYFISLIGITVGKTRLPIPTSTFALNEDGTGGVIIDSGTSITYLEEVAYDLVKEAFMCQVKLPVANDTGIGLDLCFELPSPPLVTLGLPKLVFHFEGADMELPQVNYMAIDSSTGFLCLAIQGTTGGSIIGNFQQQNMQILYDLENDMLSFVPAQCDQM